MRKKFLLLIAFLFILSDLYAAEFLVRAKGHWKDAWDTAKVNSLSTAEKDSYDSRSQRGDIIVVRPDGWNWGKEECLPNFVVVKVSDLDLSIAKDCEQSLIDNTDEKNPKTVKHRRFYIKQKTIQDAIDAGQSSINMTLSDFNNVLKGKNDKK